MRDTSYIPEWTVCVCGGQYKVHIATEELRDQGKGKNWRFPTSIIHKPNFVIEGNPGSRAALISPAYLCLRVSFVRYFFSMVVYLIST